MRYVIGVFEEKHDMFYKEYYKCEYAGILHTEKELEKATIVDDKYKDWIWNICQWLTENYPDLYFSVLVLNSEQEVKECDTSKAASSNPA